jgi:hypothetical protein
MGLLLFSPTAHGQTEESIYIKGEEIYLHKDTSSYLKSFIGSRVEGKVYLMWVIVNQKNEGSFVIQRSRDGENYEIIGITQSNMNTSNTNTGYYFIDPTPYNNHICYYRIVRYGAANDYLVSNIVKVKPEAKLYSVNTFSKQ